MDDVAELRREAARIPMRDVWTRAGPVLSRLSEDTVYGLEGRAMASFGDAAALGLWAFATGSCTAWLFQAEVLPSPQTALLFPVLIVYSGLILFIAGLFLFRRNNVFLASSFCSFAAFNLSRGVLLLSLDRGVLPAGAAADAVQGMLFEVFAYVSLSLLMAALRVNVVVALVFACTLVGFSLSGIPFITGAVAHGMPLFGRVGGYFMLAAGIFAFYGGTAVIVNSAWQRPLLPVGGNI